MIELENPISQNMKFMRSSLFPGLINTFIHNLNNGLESQKLFEIGSVFDHKKTNKPNEKTRVSGLVYGNSTADHWLDKTKKVTFYNVKGVIEKTLSSFDLEMNFKSKSFNFFHPGIASDVLDSSKTIGCLGALSPDILEDLGLKEDIFLFSLDIDALRIKSSNKFKNFSKFPSIQRDLSFVVDKEVTGHELNSLISTKAGKYLKTSNLFDVYEGKGMGENKKSIAFTLTWQSSKKTLLDSEIDKVVEMIVNSVKEELGGDLRN